MPIKVSFKVAPHSTSKTLVMGTDNFNKGILKPHPLKSVISVQTTPSVILAVSIEKSQKTRGRLPLLNGCTRQMRH